MKNIYLGLILIAVFTNALAEINSNKTFNLLCIEEDSTGFIWKNNNWKQTVFTTDKYLVKKLRNSEVFRGCESSFSPELDNKSSAVRDFSESCYEIKKFGEESFKIKNKYIGASCGESWTRGTTSEQFNLEDVACNDMQFKPNGWFHKSSARAGLQDTASSKSTLSVSVGKCSIL